MRHPSLQGRIYGVSDKVPYGDALAPHLVLTCAIAILTNDTKIIGWRLSRHLVLTCGDAIPPDLILTCAIAILTNDAKIFG